MTTAQPKKNKGAITTLAILRAILRGQPGDRPTDAALAKMAKTNIRTVYRHLAILRAAGIGIEYDGCDDPGYRMVGGWLIDG